MIDKPLFKDSEDARKQGRRIIGQYEYNDSMFNVFSALPGELMAGVKETVLVYKFKGHEEERFNIISGGYDTSGYCWKVVFCERHPGYVESVKQILDNIKESGYQLGAQEEEQTVEEATQPFAFCIDSSGTYEGIGEFDYIKIIDDDYKIFERKFPLQ